MILTLEVDDESLEMLKKLNFLVDYGYGQKIRLRHLKKKGRADEDKDENCAIPISEASVARRTGSMDGDGSSVADNEAVQVHGNRIETRALARSSMQPTWTGSQPNLGC